MLTDGRRSGHLQTGEGVEEGLYTIPLVLVQRCDDLLVGFGVPEIEWTSPAAPLPRLTVWRYNHVIPRVDGISHMASSPFTDKEPDIIQCIYWSFISTRRVLT
jgi:hypothetical protein